jgi:ABC-type lipoprotein export system ATPase subunit
LSNEIGAIMTTQITKHSIEVKNISKEFNQAGKKILLFSESSYSFQQGQTYAVTGVSGTGKSTLLNILAGIEKPTSGKVFYDEHDSHGFSGEKLRLHLQRHVGIVFQYPYLLNELNVIENIAIKGRIAGLTAQAAQQEARELLKQVGLEHKELAAPAALSGGEQQRVAVARALMMRPPFIIADEPTAHLDEDNKKVVCDLLLSCAHTFGSAVIISSHDPEIIKKMEHKLNIHQGKICHV